MTDSGLKPSTTFAVAGAGVFGAWIAYTLRQAGYAVTLFDPEGPAHARASSGCESRIIRCCYGADEIYTRMAQRSLTLWSDFFYNRLSQHLLQRTGVLWLTEPDDTHANASRMVLRKAGIPFLDLSPAQLRENFPQINAPSNGVAILEHDAGALMARAAVEALVKEFVELGGVYQQTPLAAPQKGKLPADVVIYACGPWLRKLFPDILGARLFLTRQEILFFGVPPGDLRFRPPQMPVWLDFSAQRGMYGFPDFGSGFKVACDTHGPPIDPDTDDRRVSPDTVVRMRAYLSERFPALADAAVVDTRVCQYENTSNGDFIIDQHPDLENVWLAGGGSGHGFKHGPAIGEYLLQVLRGATPETRFLLASKKTVQQRAVV